MNFTSIRIITADIEPLVQFYEKITGLSAVRYTPDFAELRTSSGTIAIGSVRTLALFSATDVARAGANSSVIIEFIVDDVDQKFEALAELIGNQLVQQPTTMPWGNRSLLFRDPDGNLINFFTPVTNEAQQRAGQQNSTNS